MKETGVYQSPIDSLDNYVYFQSYENNRLDNAEGPSRFDIPEIEDVTLGVFSSFDDITYNTKPIMQASEESNNDIIKNVVNHEISHKLQSTEDTSSLKDACKKSICSDTNSWLESESTVEFEDLQPSAKKSRNSFTKKVVNQKQESFPNINSMNSVSTHANIIREVLKKYPHLIKQNKNIRLKIMQKESKVSEGAVSGKTKISYVVLTSDSLRTDLDSSQLKSDNTHNLNVSTHGEGPWKCCKCNLEEMYIEYSSYRRHMQGVHNFKFDPRICEFCGYKANKRNILIYHMYTKHDIPLPKSSSFPKCMSCSYIALSESHLIKHQNNHKHCSPSMSSHSGNFRCLQNNDDYVDVMDIVCSKDASAYKQFPNDEDKISSDIFCSKNPETLQNDVFKNSDKCGGVFDVSTFCSSLSRNHGSKNTICETSNKAEDSMQAHQLPTHKHQFTTFQAKSQSFNRFEVDDSEIKNISNSKISENGEKVNICEINPKKYTVSLSHKKKKKFSSCESADYFDISKDIFTNTKIQQSDQYTSNASHVCGKEESVTTDYKNQDNQYLFRVIKKKEKKFESENVLSHCKSADNLKTEGIMHYIEEETEILEYET